MAVGGLRRMPAVTREPGSLSTKYSAVHTRSGGSLTSRPQGSVSVNLSSRHKYKKKERRQEEIAKMRMLPTWRDGTEAVTG